LQKKEEREIRATGEKGGKGGYKVGERRCREQERKQPHAVKEERREKKNQDGVSTKKN